MTTQQQPGIMSSSVTILDVFAKQIEMGAQLGVIHEQLRAIPDHETRLRSLERFRFSLMGAAVAVSALTSGLATWLGVIITRR